MDEYRVVFPMLIDVILHSDSKRFFLTTSSASVRIWRGKWASLSDLMQMNGKLWSMILRGDVSSVSSSTLSVKPHVWGGQAMVLMAYVQDERRPQTEVITERGQERPADWPKQLPPAKLGESLIVTPKSEWEWRKLATVNDLMPTDDATTRVLTHIHLLLRLILRLLRSQVCCCQIW